MKPVVRFAGEAEFVPIEIIETGELAEVARIWALDHPRLGKGVVRTSKVLQKFNDGSFETMNTLYRPQCPPCNQDCEQGRTCTA